MLKAIKDVYIVMLINGSMIKGNDIHYIEDHIYWLWDQSNQGQSMARKLKHSRVNQTMTIEINSPSPKNSANQTTSKIPISKWVLFGKGL